MIAEIDVMDCRSAEQLARVGGRFYPGTDAGYFCDTGSDSWKWVDSLGWFVRWEERQRPRLYWPSGARPK